MFLSIPQIGIVCCTLKNKIYCWKPLVDYSPLHLKFIILSLLALSSLPPPVSIFGPPYPLWRIAITSEAGTIVASSRISLTRKKGRGLCPLMWHFKLQVLSESKTALPSPWGFVPVFLPCQSVIHPIHSGIFFEWGMIMDGHWAASL